MNTITTFLPPKGKSIIEQFRLKKNEKPSLVKTFELVSNEDTEILKTLNKTNIQIQELKQTILSKKLSEKEVKAFYTDAKKLSGGIKSLITALSYFDVDDDYLKKIIQNFQSIQKTLSEIKDILKTYMDVQQSRKDNANGNTLSYDEIWNAGV